MPQMIKDFGWGLFHAAIAWVFLSIWYSLWGMFGFIFMLSIIIGAIQHNIAKFLTHLKESENDPKN